MLSRIGWNWWLLRCFGTFLQIIFSIEKKREISETYEKNDSIIFHTSPWIIAWQMNFKNKLSFGNPEESYSLKPKFTEKNWLGMDNKMLKCSRQLIKLRLNRAFQMFLKYQKGSYSAANSQPFTWKSINFPALLSIISFFEKSRRE